MVNFLKKCATPFIAIWRWIKETAWVQPLLIVGVIFAIIFSIPSITKGIQGLIDANESHIKYFDDHELSLDGSRLEDEGGKQNSDANKFFKNFAEAEDYFENGQEDKAREIMKQYAKDGKFWLFLVQEDCSSCSVLKNGLEYLEDNWSRYVKDSNEASFMFQSIIVDSEDDKDSDWYDDNSEESPFKQLYESNEFGNFAEKCTDVVETLRYTMNLQKYPATSSKCQGVLDNTGALRDNFDDIQTPTSILIDLTATNTTSGTSRSMITSIFYGLESSDSSISGSITNAQFLANCWTYEETSIFGSKYITRG